MPPATSLPRTCMRWDPQDEDLVVSTDQLGGDLDNGSGPLLAGAQCVREGPSDRWLTV